MVATAGYHPELFFGIGFNADPNDAVAVPVWDDQTNKVVKVGSSARGRQHELAQTMTADPSVLFRDVDEDLNPANTAGDNYPYVQPYRQLLALAQWPNAGTGNLINSGAWHGNKADAYDPTFESYANGAALPNWLTTVGAPGAPSITTATPQQGTKSATYTTAATATVQGLSWQVACVPGRQYTSSAYVRQSTASTQRIEVADQTLIYDAFMPRVAASGFGTPRFGPAYATSGTAADFAATGTQGVITPSATGSDRFAVVELGTVDQNQTTMIGPIATPATSTARQGLAGRYTDATHNYVAYAEVSTAGAVTLAIAENNAGFAVLASASVAVSAAGLMYLRFECVDSGTLRAKLWTVGTAEPSAWTVTASDTTQTGTKGGPFAEHGGSTGVSFYFDNYQGIAAVRGTSTSTTAAYVRLTVTWTATKPYHTVRVATEGTATAGTVNLDALQHEQGAAASAFTAAGPVIYPLMRPYVERFPRIWESAGFEGYCDAPCVDAGAALAAINLRPEYVDAVLATAPAYWWRLNDGENTGQWLDQSGNHGPALVRNISKYGADGDVQPGVSLPIPGDPGALGVEFTATGTGVLWQQTGTSLAAGGPASTAQIALPADPSNTWSVTAAAWYAATSNGEVQQIFGAFRPINPSSARWYSPFDIAMDSSRVGANFHSNATSGAATGTTPGYASGAPHFVVQTVTQDATNTVIKFYYDGVLNATNTIATSFFGGMLPSSANIIMVGGLFDGALAGRMLSGTVEHASIWTRELSAAEITGLWNAGGLGNAGETPGARVARDLARGGANIATRITTTSATTMQAPSWTGGIDLLTDTQNNATAESGTQWVGPDGALVFESRADRFLRLTSQWTIGEDVAGGEYPYQDGIEFDIDPIYVYPNVTAERPGGATAVGGLSADIATATRKFFPRSMPISADVQTDAMIQDLADWTFYTHRAPSLRVAQVTFDPVGYPALWPFVLSVEVGHRVTLKRRAKAANAGAGITMSADYFVENVTHNEIDRMTGKWTVTLLLSPIGIAPDVTVQPWILENSTLSVLGSTTVLGL